MAQLAAGAVVEEHVLRPEEVVAVRVEEWLRSPLKVAEVEAGLVLLSSPARQAPASEGAEVAAAEAC